jgi:hypothetical protein
MAQKAVKGIRVILGVLLLGLFSIPYFTHVTHIYNPYGTMV